MADPKTELSDAAKNLIEKLKVEFPENDEQPEAETKPKEAADMAAMVRKKYDSILHWMLGVFAAIGLLIFGSVPFVELHNVSWWILGPALFAAGVGLTIVIAATTKGLEPQDASLGEMKETFERARGSQHFWRRPSKNAAIRLRNTVQGATESEAHLGPGLASVEQLIGRLGALEKEVLLAKVGWDGGIANPAALPVLPGPAAWAGANLAKESVAKAVHAELDSATDELTELRTQLENETVPQRRGDILKVLVAHVERYHLLLAALPTPATVTSIGSASAQEAALEKYLEHRELLLQESAVSQLRGTFRTVRIWLFVGAILTLLGGIGYAFAVANPLEDDTDPRVTVKVTQGSSAWNDLLDCQSANDEDITGLDAILLSADESDGKQDGPFTFVSLDPRCEGIRVDVKSEDGSYALSKTAEASNPPLVDDPSRVVLVRLLRNTDAWKQVSECRSVPPTQDIVGLKAQLASAAADSNPRSGPFTVLVKNAGLNCVGETLTLVVEEGDGTFKRPSK